MKTTIKIFSIFFSVLLFVILIFIVTIKFELLNKYYLFGAFEKHNIYAKLPELVVDSLAKDPRFSQKEKTEYREFANNLSPQIVKPIVENNLIQVINFMNGKSKSITISFSLNGIGFENSSGLYWSSSQVADKNLQKQIEAINGTGNLLNFAGIIVLIFLINLFFLSGKIIFLSGGIGIIVASLISKILISVFGKELINRPEILQKLLGLLSVSLFSDITTTWLVAGGILIILWLALHVHKKAKLIK
jgi:hypothetical protein